MTKSLYSELYEEMQHMEVADVIRWKPPHEALMASLLNSAHHRAKKLGYVIRTEPWKGTLFILRLE